MRLTALVSVALLAAPVWAETPLPFNLGGAFDLVDHTGAPRSQVDPEGQPQLLFFGYANCQEICSAALPLMAEIVDTVEAAGHDLRPVMITVDPARDTVETLGPALRQHHEEFVGLTGSEAALQVAYDAFSVESEEIFFDPEHGPVFSHGSFLYLLDGEGKFLTLIPPILSPQEAGKIVLKYQSDAT